MTKANAIIGLMINNSSRLQCLAYRYREEPWLSYPNDHGGFSAGHYSGGETLLNVQPLVGSRDLLLSDIFPKRGAKLLLAQASMSPRTLKKSAPNTVTRRRNWFLVCDGQLDLGDRRAEIMGSLPRFLGRILDQGDNELLFGQFLAGIHENRLLDLQIHPQKLAMQLQKAAQISDSDISILVSNGNVLMAYRRGNPLYHRTFEGFSNCERCAPGHLSKHIEARTVSHDNFRGICVTNRPFGKDNLWNEVPNGGVLVIESGIKQIVFNASENCEIGEST